LENRDVVAQLSAASQTGCKTHPVTNSFGTVDEMYGAEHTPLSRPDVTNARSCTSTATHLLMAGA